MALSKGDQARDGPAPRARPADRAGAIARPRDPTEPRLPDPQQAGAGRDDRGVQANEPSLRPPESLEGEVMPVWMWVLSVGYGLATLMYNGKWYVYSTKHGIKTCPGCLSSGYIKRDDK